MIEHIKKRLEHQRSLLMDIKGSFILDKEDIFIEKLKKNYC